MPRHRCLAVLLIATLPWSLSVKASHDDDDRRLNGYELSFAAPDSRRIEQMSSPLHEATGSAAEIVARAQDCVTRLVDDRAGSPTSMASVLGAQGQRSSSTDGDTPTVESADAENGVVAHGRAQYRHLLLGYEARSRLRVEIKDGRFRIVQSELGYRQLDTGAQTPTDFAPIQRLALTGWDDALEALQDVSDQVADCIQAN